MSVLIQPRFDFTTEIAGVGKGSAHTLQRVPLNAVDPDVFNEYERLFEQISSVIGDYGFSSVFPSYPLSKNNVGDAIRYIHSDYRTLVTSLDTRKYDKQGGQISGDVYISGKLQVSDDTTYSLGVTFVSTITVGGISTFNNELKVNAPITSISSLNIKLDSTFQNSLSVQKTLTADIISTRILTCTETSTFSGLITADSVKVTNSSIFNSISAISAEISGVITSTYTSAAPFSIASTIVVTNLNADFLDNYHAGNGSGYIPISNGTVCTNLNANFLNGNTASNADGHIAISNGIMCNNLNAHKVGGRLVDINSTGLTVVVRDSNKKIFVNDISATAINCTSISSTGILTAGNITSGNVLMTGTARGVNSITIGLPNVVSFSNPDSYEITITPLNNPAGNLGEFWVDKSSYSAVIYISGVLYAGNNINFSYIAIGK